MDYFFFKRNRTIIKKKAKEIEKFKIIEDAKGEDFYKKVLELFPDAELVEVKLKDNE